MHRPESGSEDKGSKKVSVRDPTRQVCHLALAFDSIVPDQFGAALSLGFASISQGTFWEE